MWIARGHQRPHANVTPSSFVAPNVPFRMCHDTSASQFPVGAACSATSPSANALMALMAPSFLRSPALFLFSALLIVMRVAMLFPSALPMILASRGMTRLEAGRPTKPADNTATALFIAPYFLVWGAFGVAALLALMASGLIGAITGPFVFASAVTLITAGIWQVTRTKEVCVTHCNSPMSFVMHHWRSGRIGAIRMGFRHSLYCVGCCWLFMIVLFISGSMSLIWMGGISVVIFAEKLGVRTVLFSRVIGLLLVALGALAAVGGVAAL